MKTKIDNLLKNIFTSINDEIDEDEDYEPWVDAGTDGLWNYQESGFNPYGKQCNGAYDYGELFEDCGIDTVCNLEEENYSESNPDPQQDDLYLDPAGDNWNIEDSTNTEKNNLFDWDSFNPTEALLGLEFFQMDEFKNTLHWFVNACCHAQFRLDCFDLGFKIDRVKTSWVSRRSLNQLSAGNRNAKRRRR